MHFLGGESVLGIIAAVSMNHQGETISIWESVWSYLVVLVDLATGGPMAALGIVLAPYAAVFAALLAHANRMSVPKYALMGAVLSCMFFFPWIYMIRRMGGGTVPGWTITVFLAIFIMGWGLSIVFAAAFGLLIFAAPAYEVPPYYSYILLAFTGINALLWLRAIFQLSGPHESETPGIPHIWLMIPMASAVIFLLVSNYIYWATIALF